MATKAFSTRQIAERFQVDITTVQKWAAQGYFPNAYKAGPGRTSPYRIPETDVIALMKKNGGPS
ncbi:MAG: helix-turn-helix domain-containing protein [Proteobacteria bacterium]|nr:helix-turn-helix domain-containing protein [Pseudomonadota bacterium]